MAGPANTQFSVASHVLVFLSDHTARPVSSDELAGSVNVSPVHIRRVLGPLREAGLVRSRAGAHGGWELARSADSIHLDEVWDLLHRTPSVPSHSPNSACEVGRAVSAMLDDLETGLATAIRTELHSRTIADVAALVVAPAE